MCGIRREKTEGITKRQKKSNQGFKERLWRKGIVMTFKRGTPGRSDF